MTPSHRGLLGPSFATAITILVACGRDAPPTPGAAGGMPATGIVADTPEVTAGAGAPVVDAAGRAHSTREPPRRIISLVPAATETLLALGAGQRLVGRTRYDTAAALRDLPSVGGGLGPSLETILSLEPDLVVRFAGPSDVDTPRRLDAAGIAHFAVRPDGIEDVREMVRELGALVGRRDAAASLVRAIDSGLAEVRARVEGFDPVRVAFVLGGTPPWVAGPGTFIDELLAVAGGENVFSDLDGLYGPVSVEELMVRDVDLFVVTPGTRLDARVRGRAPVRAAPPGLETPGPDVGAAAAAMARLLHPEAFS